MKDISIIGEAERIGDDIYMVKCPRCRDVSNLEPISEDWDLGYRCQDCGLIFKTDYENVAGKYGRG